MLRTLETLFRGASARSEERVRDAYAIELIDQKVREAEAQLRAAKGTLASLIQRQRAEQRQADALATRILDLTQRARIALEADREDLATEAAEAIATLENEARVRGETLNRMDHQVLRLQQTVENTHRRIVDLKQGAMQARAIRREQNMQSKLRTTSGGQAAIDEAEELIARVVGADDPGEQADILADINRQLNRADVADRMADAGIGDPTRSTATDVLARLKADKRKTS
jgi:phage shock protein A